MKLEDVESYHDCRFSIEVFKLTRANKFSIKRAISILSVKWQRLGPHILTAHISTSLVLSFFLDEAHESALHMCVQRNDKEFTELLIKANADLNIRDIEDKRPVDLQIQSEEVINILKGAMFEKERVRIAK